MGDHFNVGSRLSSCLLVFYLSIYKGKNENERRRGAQGAHKYGHPLKGKMDVHLRMDASMGIGACNYTYP
jgi:hypothetical protein